MAIRIIPDSIRSVLQYDPITGHITWIETRGARKAGDLAGGPTYQGYWQITYQKISYPAHRIAWFLAHGEQPEVIDHINHDKSDNRLRNLRNVSYQANALNRKVRQGGPRWIPKGRRWLVMFQDKQLYWGKNIMLAHFHRYMAVTATHHPALPYLSTDEHSPQSR